MVPNAALNFPSSFARARTAARALHEAKERLNRRRGQATEPADDEDEERVEIQLDPEQFVTRPQGRRAWLPEVAARWKRNASANGAGLRRPCRAAP